MNQYFKNCSKQALTKRECFFVLIDYGLAWGCLGFLLLLHRCGELNKSILKHTFYGFLLFGSMEFLFILEETYYYDKCVFYFLEPISSSWILYGFRNYAIMVFLSLCGELIWRKKMWEISSWGPKITLSVFGGIQSLWIDHYQPIRIPHSPYQLEVVLEQEYLSLGKRVIAISLINIWWFIAPILYHTIVSRL